MHVHFKVTEMASADITNDGSSLDNSIARMDFGEPIDEISEANMFDYFNVVAPPVLVKKTNTIACSKDCLIEEEHLKTKNATKAIEKDYSS